MGSHKKKHHKEKKHKKDKKRKKSKKNKRHASSDSDSSPSRAVKKQRVEKHESTSSQQPEKQDDVYDVPLPPGFTVPEQDSSEAPRLPMTKEQFEARAKQVRRVFDPLTGRNRLVRGEGEIIEEVVSKDRHKQINQQATQGDGDTFQRTLSTLTK